MAELFLQIAVSVDGYIEDADRNIEWMEFDASFEPVVTRTLQSIDGMIFGRKSHSLLHGFWPSAAATAGASADLVEQARLMNALPKYVLTHGAETTGWSNSHAIRIDDIARLKSEAQRPIALFAGASAAQATLEHGLVEEVRLIQQPIALGAGTPLFAKDGRRRHFKLVECRAFASGAVMSRYRLTNS